MSATQILVVEDERLVARAIKNELEQFGYSVTEIASSADEAVKIAGESRPDLVLMDIQLRGEGDGVEAAGRIRSRWGIPVVYLSAFSDATTLDRARDTEAFGYLIKPYEERELQTTIEMALAKHRAERRLEETERWMEAIHASIGDGVLATDRNHVIRFMNAAAEGLAGWHHGKGIGVKVSEVCKFKEESRVALEELCDQVSREGCTLELPASTILISKEGREIPVEGSLSSIYDARGEFLGTVLTLRDLASRMETERMREQNEEQQRRGQKLEAVGRLAGGLSKHLNDLLTIILGNTSLAMAEWTEEPTQKEIRTLLQEVELRGPGSGGNVAAAPFAVAVFRSNSKRHVAARSESGGSRVLEPDSANARS